MEEKGRIKNFSVGKVLIIGLGFMSAMISWSFYNFKIPIILNGITDGVGGWRRVGVLGTEPWLEIIGGIIMVLDNIVAILLQPYFGKLSDRLQSKYGRRSPFFIIGVPTAVLCMLLMPFMPLFGLIGLIFVFNIAMAFYRTPVMSIMPDYVPANRRSTANSFIALMGGVGTVIGFIIPKLVEMIPGTDPVETGVFETQDFFLQDFWGFFITGAFMLLCLIIFLISFREVKTGDSFWKLSEYPIVVDYQTNSFFIKTEQEKKEESVIGELRDMIKAEEKSALFVLVAIFLYAGGFNALEFSFGRFAVSYLGISEGMAGVLLAIIPVCVILSAYAAGSSGERNGRLKSMKVGLQIMIICIIIVIILLIPLGAKARVSPPLSIIDLIPLIIFLSIAGIGYGYANINALPVVWQLAPEDRIGIYTGIYYMFTAGAAIINPILMSSIYAFLRWLNIDQWISLFPYMLVMLILSRLVLGKAKRGDAELPKEKIEDLKLKYGQDD
jgi:maltose/moltooligosaccharide transporter